LLSGGGIEVVNILVFLEGKEEVHELLPFLLNLLHGLQLNVPHMLHVNFEALPLHVREQLSEGQPVFLIDLPDIVDALIGLRLLVPERHCI
jgi:hypothetical protein